MTVLCNSSVSAYSCRTQNQQVTLLQRPEEVLLPRGIFPRHFYETFPQPRRRRFLYRRASQRPKRRIMNCAESGGRSPSNVFRPHNARTRPRPPKRTPLMARGKASDGSFLWVLQSAWFGRFYTHVEGGRTSVLKRCSTTARRKAQPHSRSNRKAGKVSSWKIDKMRCPAECTGRASGMQTTEKRRR